MIEEKQNEILELFADMEDELDMYTYLTALGGQLKHEDPELMIDSNLVKGCQSQVWLSVSLNDGKIRLYSYSNTLLVRGLLYILEYCANGETKEDWLSADIWIYRKSGLSDLLSASRRSGLGSILETFSSLVSELE